MGAWVEAYCVLESRWLALDAVHGAAGRNPAQAWKLLERWRALAVSGAQRPTLYVLAVATCPALRVADVSQRYILKWHVDAVPCLPSPPHVLRRPLRSARLPRAAASRAWRSVTSWSAAGPLFCCPPSRSFCACARRAVRTCARAQVHAEHGGEARAGEVVGGWGGDSLGAAA